MSKLLNNTVRGVAVTMMCTGSALLLVATSFLAGPSVESRALPVIEGWRVTHSVVAGDDLIVRGTLRKVRHCDFIAPPRVRDEHGEHLPVISLGRTTGLTWAPSARPQSWGPWRVLGGAQAQQIEVYFHHRCHPLWTVISVGGNYEAASDAR